jgi:hypothetical protein
MRVSIPTNLYLALKPFWYLVEYMNATNLLFTKIIISVVPDTHCIGFKIWIMLLFSEETVTNL